MKTSLSAATIRLATLQMAKAERGFAKRYPGETGSRQPVHTVYGGAHLFQADTCAKLGRLALRALDEYAPNFVVFAQAIGFGGAEGLNEKSAGFELPEAPPAKAGAVAPRELGSPAGFARAVYSRTVQKLKREPVEDFRIDFEDGYGHRADEEEDGHAVGAARELARGMAGGQLPPFIGIRIKPLSSETAARSIRTLDLFLTTLLTESRGKLPSHFVVTLPKIRAAEQVATLAQLLGKIELRMRPRIARGTVKMEIMIETPQAILNERGECNVLQLVEAAKGRCVAAHFGTYDYTASINIIAGQQAMDHPACDFAKNMMQVALTGTGIWISDGVTSILPIARHRAAKRQPELSAEQKEENRRVVREAWRQHYRDIRYSLRGGFYQGWDLHPAQLATRYAAVYAFFLEGLAGASQRLKNFVERAAQATVVGEVFDDAATAQGLLNYFLRAVNCGALSEAEAEELSGLTIEELRSGSFRKIFEGRRSKQ